MRQPSTFRPAAVTRAVTDLRSCRSGYDYNSDWTPLLAGLAPAGMAASLAAPDPYVRLSRIRLPPRVSTASLPYALQRREARLPGTEPGTGSAGAHSPWSQSLAHRLRSGSLRIVRRLHGYYDWVRLLVPVHHRLRLLAFPMRTRSAQARVTAMVAAELPHRTHLANMTNCSQ
jgi:hypothetical protein